jgi:ABC-type transport system involved in Fe-S cluster assembly fused permease/ATPase subunit
LIQRQTLRSLLPYLWPRNAPGMKARVVFALLFLTASKLANVSVPLLFKRAVDAVAPQAGDLLFVPVGFILAYGLARILAGSFAELRDLVFIKVAQRAIRQIALSTFRHLHALSLAFHLERRTGAVNRSLERGTKGIEFILNFLLFNIVPTILEVGLVCTVLWSMYDALYALLTGGTILVYALYTFSITEWRTKFRRAMNETDTDAAAKATDSLLNYETVKYFGNEEHEARRYDGALARYEQAAIKSKTSLSVLNIGQNAVIAGGLVLVMIVAARGVAAGSLTVGDFVLVNAYLLQLYLPLNFLGMVYREIKQALIDMEAMFALLLETEEVADRPGAPGLAVTGGRVRFENVSFAYNPARQILKDVSFEVPPGRTVALVGPSGAGKSTISRLLFRFYDVGQGRILIDGQDIREVQQFSLRQAIGIVPQDTVLFNDTLHYNIAYGRPDATPEDIIEAARLAQVDDFTRRLPEGYQSLVGERGLKLSGGEKQRVAIARTLLKRPAILVFDEATSALDTRTEKEIQASLKDVSKGRTTLVIAHRLSTIIDADEILVLDHGRIVERGRHGDLLAQGGVYAGMWARQLEAQAAQETLAKAMAEEAEA